MELIASRGAKRIRYHLVSAPANVTFMSLEYVAKYINIIATASIPMNGYFTFFCDETSDIASIE